MKHYDAVVIGGGPAGMNAALNLKRMGKTVLILEREAFGGQIATSPRVENLPGIESISGADFSDKFFTQIMDIGVEFELEEAKEIRKDELFYIKTDYNEYSAKTVFLACGVKHRHIGVAREEELTGKGVSYCAVCDGAFYKDEDVAVIGDANSALQYALMLANYCKKVHLCMLFDRYFADKVLIERVESNPVIEVHKEISLKEFQGEDELEGLLFNKVKTNEPFEVKVKAVFIAIGQVPSNEAFAEFVDLKNGYILTDENMETKTPGLYAIGDCRFKAYRQVSTAVNDGTIAAIHASNTKF